MFTNNSYLSTFVPICIWQDYSQDVKYCVRKNNRIGDRLAEFDLMPRGVAIGDGKEILPANDLKQYKITAAMQSIIIALKQAYK
ncbi:hypothetical protein SNE25_28715 [Mucilaginibacter sabulilitoris]|uniref:Uncharacterized protein n=1 Tax=Mucilaginibacter sabulilitoris TaxID=1173583 RepID=A0ABZ0TKT8_9SPHI|nr:hypothetical protein [Mucilaginibacter sabulilitoris]WPU93306.1 hypothetical protein SNE25_28715 [Mucilaginibacter sabulilitoris]